MTLQEYYDLLEAHDWYYARSDSHETYRKGMENRLKLFGISQDSKEHKQLFMEWESYMMYKSRGKPERPHKEMQL